MPKAKNLSEVIEVFDPRESLVGDALRDFYVDRPGNPLLKMEQELISLRNSSVKVLFYGHRGSGKSTELNKLADRLAKNYGNRYETITVNVNRYAGTLVYQDVLMTIAFALFNRAVELEAVGKAPVQVVQEALDSVRIFIQDQLYGKASLKVPQLQSTEVSATLKTLVTELEAKYTLSTITRTTLQEFIDQNLDELRNQIDLIAGLILQRTQRRVLFAVEGTDRPDPERALRIFRDHTYALTCFRLASAIYTFPIELVYAPEFGQMKDAFGVRHALPNFKVKTKADDNQAPQPDTQGLECLRQIVLSRMEAHLIEPTALTILTEASGGAVRFLVRMVRTAAANALARNETEQIKPQDAQVAIIEELRDFIRSLRSEHYPVLWQRSQDNTLDGDEIHQTLLHMSALLEYSNGGAPWCDVHPIIFDEVRKRTGH